MERRNDGLDAQFGCQRVMYGTAIRDVDQSLALIVRQRAGQIHVPGDPLYLALIRLAVLTIDAVVAQPDADTLQRDLLARGKHLYRHRGARAEGR